MLSKNQKFLILGVSKSGVAVAEYLLEQDICCYLFDEINTEKVVENISRLESKGAVRLNREIVFDILREIDAVIISPGVPINHEIAVSAKKLGKRIIGELEFGFSQLRPNMVAITGTNGKTTTVSMVEAILSGAGIENKAVGNVGRPITSEVNNVTNNTVLVTEVSSFQLESISAFLPNIACVLNIAPDHLERHYNMENYIFLKKRIFKNQTGEDYAVLNFDDKIVKDFAKEIKSKVVWVSDRAKVDGAYTEGGQIKYMDEYVMEESELPLGVHNRYNALFAVAICKLLGVKTSDIRKYLSEFKGVKHRLELVQEKNNVKYFNDSKSTNTASTISALRAMSAPTVLILGGSEKGEKYDELFKEIKGSNVRHTVITGASRINMLNSAMEQNLTDISVAADFQNAIKIAALFAESGDAVLFSPACASFDRFASYEERGEAFVKLIGELN